LHIQLQLHFRPRRLIKRMPDGQAERSILIAGIFTSRWDAWLFGNFIVFGLTEPNARKDEASLLGRLAESMSRQAAARGNSSSSAAIMTTETAATFFSVFFFAFFLIIGGALAWMAYKVAKVPATIALDISARIAIARIRTALYVSASAAIDEQCRPSELFRYAGISPRYMIAEPIRHEILEDLGPIDESPRVLRVSLKKCP